MAGASSNDHEARRLTTHVLDTASGKPAEGVDIELFFLQDGDYKEVAQARTNSDGRCDEPLLAGDALRSGSYELRFHAGSYFERQAPKRETFLTVVPVRFRVGSDVPHLHVPLLISPFGYSTYRGS